MKKNEYKKFWKKRSKNYEKLQWAIKSGYLHEFLKAGSFDATDIVLDIGTGTGIVAHLVSGIVDSVTGIDISGDMLSHAFDHRIDNERFLIGDARSLDFKKNTFSKVTARMVFHHILDSTQEAMNECLRVLKRSGKMIFSEGVPPTQHVKDFYTEMFKLKEERLTFMDEDLLCLMSNAGFVNIRKIIYRMPRVSVKNWLDNSGLNETNKATILKMHRELDERGKRDYNMTLTKDDCLIDMKFVILVGQKP